MVVLDVKGDQCLEASEINFPPYSSLLLQSSPMALKGEWQVPAIILSATKLPYSTVTKQGAHSSVIPTHFPPLLMLLFFFPSSIPSAPISLSEYESCEFGEK